MKVLFAISAALGLAAAAPAVVETLETRQASGPQKVKIHGMSLLGTGCPKGSTDVQVDATGSMFEVTFSKYEVHTGPGTKATDHRKNCKLTLNMEFDPGFQCVATSPFFQVD
jgi:hypothetical protein